MNPIKKLYQKLLGSSDDEVQTEDEEAEAEETQGKEDELSDGESPCYLFFEVDDDGVVKMSCYWDGSEFSLAAFTELLYNLCTGEMTGNIFQFLENEGSVFQDFIDRVVAGNDIALRHKYRGEKVSPAYINRINKQTKHHRYS